MELEFYVKIFLSLALLAFFGLLVGLYHGLVVKPTKLRARLGKQGIKGPPPSLLLGNIREIKKAQANVVKVPSTQPPATHNCTSLLFPFFEQWRKQYGMYCMPIYAYAFCMRVYNEFWSIALACAIWASQSLA